MTWDESKRRANLAKHGDVTHKRFPETPEEWEALIAEASGEDRALVAKEEAAWANAVVVKEGGLKWTPKTGQSFKLDTEPEGVG